MARYHINPKTGNPGACNAQHACPFGGAEDHYSSEEKARAAFELSMAADTFKQDPMEQPSLPGLEFDGEVELHSVQGPWPYSTGMLKIAAYVQTHINEGRAPNPAKIYTLDDKGLKLSTTLEVVKGENGKWTGLVNMKPLADPQGIMASRKPIVVSSEDAEELNEEAYRQAAIGTAPGRDEFLKSLSPELQASLKLKKDTTQVRLQAERFVKGQPLADLETDIYLSMPSQDKMHRKFKPSYYAATEEIAMIASNTDWGSRKSVGLFVQSMDQLAKDHAALGESEKKGYYHAAIARSVDFIARRVPVDLYYAALRDQ